MSASMPFVMIRRSTGSFAACRRQPIQFGRALVTPSGPDGASKLTSAHQLGFAGQQQLGTLASPS